MTLTHALITTCALCCAGKLAIHVACALTPLAEDIGPTHDHPGSDSGVGNTDHSCSNQSFRERNHGA